VRQHAQLYRRESLVVKIKFCFYSARPKSLLLLDVKGGHRGEDLVRGFPETNDKYIPIRKENLESLETMANKNLYQEFCRWLQKITGR
jgi:hypothetical protein